MLSRVAESLYWLSCYIERAENNSRILDVNLQLTLDMDHCDHDEKRSWSPILATLEDQTLFNENYPTVTADGVCEFVTFAKENPNSILSSVSRARENARTVREYISSEMWERINSLYLWLNSVQARQIYAASAIDFYRHVVDCSHQFHGTTDATLTHGEGWSFLQLGKYLERGDSASRILDLKYHILLPTGEKVGGNVDTLQWIAVLKSCSAFEAYRKVRTGQVTPASVTEFIILHDRFPRSIRFCVDNVVNSLHALSGSDPGSYCNEAERLAGRLKSDLNYATIKDIFEFGLHQYLDKIQVRLCDIASAMYETYCDWMETEETKMTNGEIRMANS